MLWRDVSLNALLQEVLRLRPPFPIVEHLVSEDISVGGYNIPKGTSTPGLLYSIHRNTDVYADPEKFDPQRGQLPRSGCYHTH